MIHSLVSQLVLGVLIATCAFAFLKGGAAERWGAIFICGSWLAGDAASFFMHGVFSQQNQELTLLAMDAALAISLLILALRFAKMWLGVAMLMQSAELALHGAVMADWGLPFYQYILFNNVINLGIILLLGGATATAWVQQLKAKQALNGVAQEPPVWLRGYVSPPRGNLVRPMSSPSGRRNLRHP